MPYIAPPSRPELDVHIEVIVKLIKDDSNDRFGYLKSLQFVLGKLSKDLLFSFTNDLKFYWTYKNASFQRYAVHISELKDAIIAQIESEKDREEKLSGLYNYCCTQIIFLSLSDLRYWTFNQARSACAVVALKLYETFSDENELVNILIGVLLCDIPDESYRRVGVDYEEKKIRENGDVAGYKRWNPDEFYD